MSLYGWWKEAKIKILEKPKEEDKKFEEKRREVLELMSDCRDQEREVKRRRKEQKQGRRW